MAVRLAALPGSARQRSLRHLGSVLALKSSWLRRSRSRTSRRYQAPWQRLNFLPLPHQHGSLRPILSRSETTRWVATEPPPASSAPAVEPPLPPSSAPAPAAAIASEPASDSCSYAKA